MDMTPTSTPEVSSPPNTPQHPLFYLSFMNHPFLQIPRVASPHSVLSPSRNSSGTLRHQSAAWAMPVVNSATPSSSSSSLAITSSQHHQQSSNFSINKILEGSSIPPDLLSHMAGPQTKALQATGGLSMPPEPRALLDTAKMLWLHQLACSQSSHLSPGPSSVDHKNRVTKKRKLGRNPRIPFTQQQIDRLERKYTSSRYLSSLDVAALSKELDLSEPRVKIWFQNRRARERRDKRINLSHLSSEQAPGSTLLSPVSISPPERVSSIQPSSHRQTSLTGVQAMWSTSELGVTSPSLNSNYLLQQTHHDSSTQLANSTQHQITNPGEVENNSASSSSITSSLYASKGDTVNDDS